MATEKAPVDLARSILADPRRAFTASTRGLAAVCQALVDATDNVQPVITNELAAAARALIVAEAAANLAKGPEGYAPLKIGLAREMAFQTFKQIFEEEFPHDVH